MTIAMQTAGEPGFRDKGAVVSLTAYRQPFYLLSLVCLNYRKGTGEKTRHIDGI